ncbi:MAG: RNA recognition motif domain-containing protein [Pseudanabaenaceae cyanobacterium]
MSVRLYVGNLPPELDREALEQVFNEGRENPLSLKVITDRKTGKCRGFGFMTVESEETAQAVIEKFNGYDFNGAVLKLEVALSRHKEEKEEKEQKPEAQPTANSEAPAREVPKPTLKSARTNPRTEVNLDAKPPKVETNTNNSSGGGKRRKNRKHKDKEKQAAPAVAFSYADTPDAHQPDPRWAQELALLRQRLLDAQAVK